MSKEDPMTAAKDEEIEYAQWLNEQERAAQEGGAMDEDRIQLTDDECHELVLKATTRCKFLLLVYGATGAMLTNEPQNDWAIALVNERRSQKVTQ